MTRDLHCSAYLATVGLSVYPLGFAVFPLFTAPFSEEVGRRPLYLLSAVGFTVFHIMVGEYAPILCVHLDVTYHCVK